MLNFPKSKQVFAKILAEENIKVVQTNTATAYFDIAHRVLCLPYWKDSKDTPYSDAVTDMLVAHEVAHALWTPLEGIHTFGEEKTYKGIPFSVLNILEDARIEKLIKQKYTYYILLFNDAYKEMWDRKSKAAWKIKSSKDFQHLNFISRINFYFKFYPATKNQWDIRHIIHSKKEWEIIRMIEEAQTFEEILQISYLVYEKPSKEREIDEDLLAELLRRVLESDEYDWDEEAQEQSVERYGGDDSTDEGDDDSDDDDDEKQKRGSSSDGGDIEEEADKLAEENDDLMSELADYIDDAIVIDAYDFTDEVDINGIIKTL